jgi:hypothetical protein
MERKEIPVQTLSEMARETKQLEAASRNGIACPVCGCRDLRVQTTRRGEGLILRYRVCRNCGAHKPTIES